MNKNYTEAELRRDADQSFERFDVARIDWEVACVIPGTEGFRWRNQLQALFVPSRMFHPVEVLDASLAKLFHRRFPKLRYSPSRRIAAVSMCYASLWKESRDWGNSAEAQQHAVDVIERWLTFPYKRVKLKGNRDRLRYEQLGALPGEPDPEPDQGDIIVAKKKKTSKKVSTAPGKSTGSKKVGKKVGRPKGKGKPKAEPTARDDRPTPFGDNTSYNADGEAYDKRFGRPGSARGVFCELLLRAKGATEKELVAAACKAGLYPNNESGHTKARNQLKMNIMAFRRDGPEDGYEFKVMNEDKKQYRVVA